MIIFSQAFETGDSVVVTASTQRDTTRDERIVAIDKEGHIHTPKSRSSLGSNDLTQITVEFHGLKRNDIQEFQFQTRPYQWVTFKNVSLRPGIKTDIEINMETSGFSTASNTMSLEASQQAIAATWTRNRSVPETAIDLTPAAFDIRLDEKRGTGYLIVSIQNNTDIPLPKHRIRFYRGDPAQGLDETGHHHSGRHEAGPIQPGKTRNERTIDFHLPDGEYDFTVVLDYDQTVPEPNENNNSAALHVKIQNGQIVEKTNLLSETKAGNPIRSVTEINHILLQWFVFCRNDQSVEASRLWHPEDSDGDIYKETRQVLAMEPGWQFGGITEALFFEEDGIPRAVALSNGFAVIDEAFGEKSAVVWDLARPAGQSWRITQSSFVKLAKWELSMRAVYLQQHPQARVWKRVEPSAPETNSDPLPAANNEAG